MQAYSDPAREADAYALPDLEVWKDRSFVVDCPCCGSGEYPGFPLSSRTGEADCPTCGVSAPGVSFPDKAYWYWFCFPGCLPDSDAVGPFDSEAEALADARAE